MLRLFTIAATLVALASLASAQGAPPPPPPPGGSTVATTTVHEGVFVRAQLGLGFFHASASEGGTDVAVSGAGPSVDLAGGFAVNPNLIVHGSLFYDLTSSPTVEINGQSMDVEGSAAMVGIGAGITYYTASNIYATGVLAMTQLLAEDDGETDGSEWGPGVALGAGKEWYLAPKTAIGVGARLAIGSQKIDPDVDVSYTTTTFSLLFSATYN
jgi:hypothetical protein